MYNLIADEYAQGSDTYRLNYINLPVIFKYYVGNRWSVDFGPQFGVMLNASYVEDDGYLAKDPVGVHYQFSSFDTSFCIGTTFNFTDNIAITVRYNQGLIDCYKDEVISIHNNVLQAGLDFSF
ncbi:MAG: outer membrane beta-barrel protein [Rikenellaceae bacterium]